MKTEKKHQYKVEILVAYAVNGTLEDSHSEVKTKFIDIPFTEEEYINYDKIILAKIAEKGNYRKLYAMIHKL